MEQSSPRPRPALWQLMVLHLALLSSVFALIPLDRFGVLRWLLAALLLLAASFVGAWAEILYPHTRSYD